MSTTQVKAEQTESELAAIEDKRINTPIEGTMDERYSGVNKATAKMDFGAGQYSSLGYETAGGSMLLLGFTPKMAEKLGKQVMTDYGKAMSSEKAIAKASAKSGAKGKINLSSSIKFKGHDGTPALRIMTAIEWIGQSVKNGIGYGQTSWKLFPSEEIEAYLKVLQADKE